MSRASEKMLRKLSKRKRSTAKSLLFMGMLCAALGMAAPASANDWSYAGDPGFVARNPADVATAAKSWETSQYLRSGGLARMNASTAYALGFFGQGATVGVMDSGSLATHPSFQNVVLPNGTTVKSWNFVTQKGVYGYTGTRYRGSGANFSADGNMGQPFVPGQVFDLTGAYDKDINDSHGTSVTGIVSGNRDGSSNPLAMHGIAWGSNMVIGNTGATDSNNYGPFQDYNYFYTGYKAMVDAGAQVINNSWGTNARINLPKTASFPYGVTLGEVAWTGNNDVKGADGSGVGNHIWTNNVPQAEYEYFYSRKLYGDNPSFIEAAYDAVKGTNVVHIMTTGNRDNANPFYRALYPYFNPEAEKHWIAAAGIQQVKGDPSKLTIVDNYNEAGLAKWWTVVGYSLNDAYTTNLAGSFGTNSFSGTSCSAPHIAGAMGVLMSRYQNMNAQQVRDVMFTTASRHNTDGSLYAGWTSADGVPDERYGWGMPDLSKGMYGPGQFLGKFEYNASNAPLDVWSNNITNQGLDARKAEDQAWLAKYKETLANDLAGLGLYNNGQNARDGLLTPGTTFQAAATGDYFLGDAFVIMDNDSDNTNHIISQEDAVKWRKEYAAKRAADIENKLANNLYEGSLVKQGPGILVMTGDNTYKGGSTVQNGALYGFTESFGTGTVNVDGGFFGVLSSYNDLFTMKGQLTSTQSRLANISVNNGGIYTIMTGNDVNVGALNFNKGAGITVAAAETDVLRQVFENRTLTASGSVTATNLTGVENMMLNPDYAFFNTNLTVAPSKARAAGTTITGTLSWNETSLANYAADNNGRSLASVISTNVPNTLMDNLLWSTKGQVRDTLDTLSNDTYLNADNASIVNSLALTRTIKNQALGLNAGQNFHVNENTRVWATGVGSWSTLDFGRSDVDGEFYVGLAGMETNITPNNKIGLFVGAGTSEFESGHWGKIESDDLHVGLYGASNVADVVSLTYGVTHTRQNRDAHRTLTVIDQFQRNNIENDTDITQFFAEAAYTQFNTDRYTVEPYVGFNVLRLKTTGFTERAGGYEFITGSNTQVMEVATVGLRGSLPVFENESMKLGLRGDLSGSMFMGDTRPEADYRISNIGMTTLKGGKMNDPLLNVGLGLNAAFGETVSVGLSYEGSFNGDVKSNGVAANFRIAF